MKTRSFFSFNPIFLLGTLFSANCIFATTSSDDLRIKKIVAEEKKLERELNGLNGELRALKQTKKNGQADHQQFNTISRSKRSNRYPDHFVQHLSDGNSTKSITPFQRAVLSEGLAVITSPYLGLRSAYDASDLVVNISTMNEDLRLLQQRKILRDQLTEAGIFEPSYFNRPVVILSGGVEGQAYTQRPYTGSSISDIDLTKVEFDVLSYISKWATAFISLRYDNSFLPNVVLNGEQFVSGEQVGSGQRIANSKVFVRRGFVTIGNLTEEPFYFTIGQMFAPFGSYTSQMLTTLSTQAIGQTNQRTALLGFSEHGIYAEGYAYRGDTQTTTNSKIDDGGFNIGYNYNGDGPVNFNFGGGFLGNMADSLGLQLTGTTAGFQGFGFNTQSELIKHGVSATDVHGQIDIKKLSLVGEYIFANGAFNPIDLNFNREGARPKALHLEGDYSFNLIRFPSVFTLAYEHTAQALALSLPENTFAAVLNTSFWKDTIETIEFRHDENYPTSDIAGGNNTFNFAQPDGSGFLNLAIPSTGGSQNSVTVQIGAYF